MAFYNVQNAVTEYLNKYRDLKRAIVTAQRSKSKAKSEDRFEFWYAVELELKKLLPPKTYKVKYTKED